MPRVQTRTRTKGGFKTYTCAKCGQPVEPGQTFYTWAFRYGGRRYQHTTCGAPRRSQLTQSMMGEVFEAIEQIEDVDDGDLASLADALDNLVEVARDVSSRYESAAEAFGGVGENQERYEQLDGWIDELDGKAETIREAVEAADEAKSAVDNCPI